MSIQQDIEEGLQVIDKFEKEFMEKGKAMMAAYGGTMYEMDLLGIGVINRSLSLLSAFCMLIRNDNFMAAAHLVRLHLDSYMRFSACWEVENPTDLVARVLNGEKISKIEDRDGKPLRDHYLVEKASLEFPWMQQVYDTCSGFVHLSCKHILTSSKLKNLEERTVERRISKGDKYVPDESRLEGILAMAEITQAIFYLLNSWTSSKNNPPQQPGQDLHSESGHIYSMKKCPTCVWLVAKGIKVIVGFTAEAGVLIFRSLLLMRKYGAKKHCLYHLKR